MTRAVKGSAKPMTNAAYQRKRIFSSPASLIAQLSCTVRGYAKREGCPIDCAVRDALTDLRHLCDIHGLDFGEIDSRAHDGYREELNWREDTADAQHVGGAR